MAENSGTAWTAQDDETLMRCAKTGKSLDYAAKTLGRTPSAALARLENVIVNELRWRELCAKATEIGK